MVGTAADGAAALEEVRRTRPGRRPDGPADAGHRRRERDPADRGRGRGPDVLVLTSFSDADRIVAALDAGAVGYLLKDADPDDIIEGVRAVARGESPLHPRAARQLLGARHAAATEVDLTPRENEVLVLVRQGLANKQIARRLGITERTVKAHLTSVFASIGVVDRDPGRPLGRAARAGGLTPTQGWRGP